jgi:hypothetical protein
LIARDRAYFAQASAIRKDGGITIERTAEQRELQFAHGRASPQVISSHGELYSGGKGPSTSSGPSHR